MLSDTEHLFLNKKAFSKPETNLNLSAPGQTLFNRASPKSYTEPASPHSATFTKAITPLCLKMCPAEEALQRALNKRFDFFESDRAKMPAKAGWGAMQAQGETAADPALMVKAFRRSEAGMAMAPEIIRPHKVLLRTCYHLLVSVLGYRGRGFLAKTAFVSDRLRAVRQDLVVLHDTQTPFYIEIVEKSCRFHLLAMYLNCDKNLQGGYDSGLNGQYLNSALCSLISAYSESACVLPNESHYRALYILLSAHHWDPSEYKSLPASLQSSQKIQLAIGVYNAIKTSDHNKFFSLFKHRCGFFEAVCLHQYLPLMRFRLLRDLARNGEVPLETLFRRGLFDSLAQTKDFCEKIAAVVIDKTGSGEPMVFLPKSVVDLPKELAPREKPNKFWPNETRSETVIDGFLAEFGPSKLIFYGEKSNTEAFLRDFLSQPSALINGSEDKNEILNVLNNNSEIGALKADSVVKKDRPGFSGQKRKPLVRSDLGGDNIISEKSENFGFAFGAVDNNNKLLFSDQKPGFDTAETQKIAETRPIFTKIDPVLTEIKTITSLNNPPPVVKIKPEKFLTAAEKVSAAEKSSAVKKNKTGLRKTAKIAEKERKIKRLVEKKKKLRNLIRNENKRLYLSLLGCFEKGGLELNGIFSFGFNLTVLGKSNDAFYKLAREWLPKNLFLAKLEKEKTNSQPKKIISFFSENAISKKLKSPKLKASKSFAPSLTIVLKDEFSDSQKNNFQNKPSPLFKSVKSVLSKTNLTKLVLHNFCRNGPRAKFLICIVASFREKIKKTSPIEKSLINALPPEFRRSIKLKLIAFERNRKPPKGLVKSVRKTLAKALGLALSHSVRCKTSLGAEVSGETLNIAVLLILHRALSKSLFSSPSAFRAGFNEAIDKTVSAAVKIFCSRPAVSLTPITEKIGEKLANSAFFSIKNKKCRKLRKALGFSKTELFLRDNPKLAKVCERLAKIKVPSRQCESSGYVGLAEILEFSSDVFGVIAESFSSKTLSRSFINAKSRICQNQIGAAYDQTDGDAAVDAQFLIDAARIGCGEEAVAAAVQLLKNEATTMASFNKSDRAQRAISAFIGAVVSLVRDVIDEK